MMGMLSTRNIGLGSVYVKNSFNIKWNIYSRLNGHQLTTAVTHHFVIKYFIIFF